MVDSKYHVICLLWLLPFNRALTGNTMRAVVATGRGSADGDFSKVKLVSDHPVPEPGHGQVLIRVAASSVNPVDWKLLSSPVMTAATLLSSKVLGFDVSGTIEKVGNGCTRLKVGDRVWADLGESSVSHLPLQLGAWAEYAVADESQVGLKPQSLSFQDAASLPLAALTDYQAFKKAGAPWKDRRNLTVVITSGAGGTGTPAIQMAKAYGASRIITAASASHITELKSLGATDVIDYHNNSIWDVLPADSVDVVYDNYGAPGTADLALPAIRTGGVFIFLPGKGGSTSKHAKAGVKEINYGLCDSSHHEDLDALKTLADAGHLKAVVDEIFPLESIFKALNASFAGHVFGKVAIDIVASHLEEYVPLPSLLV
eukprot:gnl/MRDRNA2_/MRDRNA2_164856_c0_seq1.p1 gnl/MRDRNA2_/MRDRNA2_164856_c0~~gnl/MRDRNA2_/MRDRNA2_164856_c0_seq1.p1  ORF type:complete len:372 (-),score=65.00 gnl/MRDRNA2_/MRDRNA2_164856_c0_seq1:145-1260(-)